MDKQTSIQPRTIESDSNFRVQVCLYDDNRMEILRFTNNTTLPKLSDFLDKDVVTKYNLIPISGNTPIEHSVYQSYSKNGKTIQLTKSEGEDFMKIPNIDCNIMFLKHLELKEQNERDTSKVRNNVMMYGIQTQILKFDRKRIYGNFIRVSLTPIKTTDYYISTKSSYFTDKIRQIVLNGSMRFTDYNQMMFACNRLYLEEGGEWTAVDVEHQPRQHELDKINKMFSEQAQYIAVRPNITKKNNSPTKQTTFKRKYD